jgi:DNA-binding SARP family transcriptional activator
MTKFRILGALEIHHQGRICPPLPPKVRCVLTLLLMHAGQVVTSETLMTELWGERLPVSATTTLQTYIYQLRKMFDAEGVSTDDGGTPVVTGSSGYLLRFPPECLDATTFEAEVAAAVTCLATGHPVETVHRIRQVLASCRGAPLTDVPRGPLLEAYAVHLSELRIRATELRLDAEMQLGHHRELIGELQSLVAEYPLNEWFHGHLMTALDHSGRRADALRAYQRLHSLLDTELGLVPSDEIEQLHLQVLTGVPTQFRRSA